MANGHNEETEEGLLKTLGLLEEMLFSAEQSGLEDVRERLVKQIIGVRDRLDAARAEKTTTS